MTSFALVFLGWLLFGILLLVATLIAFVLKSLGRKVTRDDVLILFTKAIGATLFGLLSGLMGAAVTSHFLPKVEWLGYIAAIAVGLAAAALTWKFGKAQITRRW